MANQDGRVAKANTRSPKSMPRCTKIVEFSAGDHCVVFLFSKLMEYITSTSYLANNYSVGN